MTAETTGCRTIAADNTGRDCHGMPGDGAEFDGLTVSDQDAVTRVWVNAGKAIGAYERRLECGPGRFDAWMQGDDEALDAAEIRGAVLFVGERSDGTAFRGCHTCHQGPLLTDQGFHNVGLAPRGVGPAGSFLDPEDRGAVDGLAESLHSPLNVRGVFSDGDDGRLPASAGGIGAYRTPSLRCVTLRPAYMHTGQILNLHDVVEFFAEGGSPSGYPGDSELEPLHLTEDEQADLTAFLHALEGEGPAEALRIEPP
jgi:cytochrome c peroxidase